MCASIEALAMAGVDCLEWDLDFEEWAHQDLKPPPPHLLLSVYDDDLDGSDHNNGSDASVLTVGCQHQIRIIVERILKQILEVNKRTSP
ncbi:hypothetical protein Patl1_12411 [Pistacia atlantica]|uniref:Uncharacterized protein n=1 Tax=Pistacia atlantica TaxID=434234 RepID=A0ACC1A8H7_9ROSI|nr:hypothetical protein Patl1_12411 [Pistacia atlantica]